MVSLKGDKCECVVMVRNMDEKKERVGRVLVLMRQNRIELS